LKCYIIFMLSLLKSQRFKMAEIKKKTLIQRIWARKKLLAVVAVLVVGWIGYQRFVVLPRKAAVETARVEKGEVKEELVLSGEINADEYAKLSFLTSGQIAWVGAKEGDLVKKGQALAKIDTVTLNATYQQAKASLREEEATVENIHDQVKGHSGDETFSQKDTRTAAEVAKDKAYEAYIAAEYNLRNSTLIAPFAGIITSLAHPFSGVNVFATETQVELINPQTLYFDVSAAQSEVLKLSIGQEVNITLDSVSDEELKGNIVFIGYTPKADEVGTIYKVKVAFDDLLDIKKFRVGLTGDATFVISKKENVLFVPPKFVKSDLDGKYLKKSGKNGKTYVEIGLEGEDATEIVSDKVKEGDNVFD